MIFKYLYGKKIESGPPFLLIKSQINEKEMAEKLQKLHELHELITGHSPRCCTVTTTIA